MSTVLSDEETNNGRSTERLTNASNLGQHMENYNVEASALHRKLQSKTDALRILRKELERFRTERDQFKLMAETLQLRYSSIKKSSDYCCGNNAGGSKSNVAKFLHETRERNIKLTTEVESLKSKLLELQGDIELLRDAKGKKEQRKTANNIGKSKRGEYDQEALDWQNERADFICHLEHLKKTNAQLCYDLKSLIDEKAELALERDAYKCKAHRLNHELLAALKANEKHPKFLDIDSVLLENTYLHEQLKSCEIELEMSKQNVSKYKTMLDTKRKKGIIKLGSSSNDESILSHKQVKSLLESGIELPTKTETIQDLKSLCLTLLDNLNDKNLALNHQKRTNKILGAKIGELEQRIHKLAGNNDGSVNYSPTQYLMQGYCPSQVDSIDDGTTSNMTTTSSTTIATATSNNSAEKTRQNSIATNKDEFKDAVDDGASSSSSLSTESAKSVLSSEYGGLINGNNNKASDAAANFDEYSSAVGKYFSKTTFANSSTPSSTTIESSLLRLNSPSYASSLVSSAIEQERQNDLKDLPPDLAALVQQALHELDMREFETKVVLRDMKFVGKSGRNNENVEEEEDDGEVDGVADLAVVKEEHNNLENFCVDKILAEADEEEATNA